MAVSCSVQVIRQRIVAADPTAQAECRLRIAPTHPPSDEDHRRPPPGRAGMASCASILATISGPMPQGSPGVSATTAVGQRASGAT